MTRFSHVGRCLTVCAALASSATITVDTSKPLRTKRPGLYGCHIDPGFDHQWQQFTSNLIFNSEFETYSMPGSDATYRPQKFDNTSQSCDGTATSWGKFGLESNVDTLEQCQALCTQNDQCHFLQYQPSRSKCHLYKDCSTARSCTKACERTFVRKGGGVVNTTYWYGVAGQAMSYTSNAPFNGLQAATLSTAGDALINTGFHSQGLSLEAGKPYEGYLYIRSEAPAQVSVALEGADGAELAVQTLQHPGGGTWQREDFSGLVPSAATSCEASPWGEAPLNCYSTLQQRPGHACWRCGGSFAIRLIAGSNVDVDAAWLQPGEWGRFAGLPVLSRTAEMLQDMKVDVLRLGGTYVKTDRLLGGGDEMVGSTWKHYRGPAEMRSPAVQKGSGIDADIWGTQLRSRHFGLFEAASLAEAMDAQVVLTLSHLDTPQDVADLVDYMFSKQGDWAATRASDGHAEPYAADMVTFELGNEMNNTNFAAQAMAMEAKAEQLGLGKRIRYAAPLQNLCKDAFADLPVKCDVSSLKTTKHLGAQVLLDFHTTDGLDRVDVMSDLVKDLEMAELDVRFAIWETNTGTLHNQQRALMEAVDTAANERNRDAMRLDTRTMSFCTEISGHDDLWSKEHGDQGAIFVAPNQTWGQPPYHAHVMLADAWRPIDIAVTADGLDSLDIAAAWDGEGDITLRVVNSGEKPATALLVVLSDAVVRIAASRVQSAVLAADLQAVNPAAAPNTVVPVRSVIDLAEPLLFPAHSITTLALDGAGSGAAFV